MAMSNPLFSSCLGLLSTLALSGCLSPSKEPDWDPGPWTKVESPLDTSWITAVGATEDHLFVGTNHAFFASESGGFSKPLASPRSGLVWRIAVSGEVVVVDGSRYLSMDGGATWSEFNTPPPFGPGGEFIGTVRRVTPAGPNLFANATGGDFVSADRGVSWIPFALTDTPLVVAGQGEAEVRCSLKSCSVSSDGGLTMRGSDLKPWPASYSLHNLGDFWVMWGESNSGTILLSGDAGSTWSASPRPFGAIEALAMTPAGSLFVVDGDSELHTSMDRGKTWQRVKEPQPPVGDFIGMKSVGYWKHAVWVGTTQGLWKFQVP